MLAAEAGDQHLGDDVAVLLLGERGDGAGDDVGDPTFEHRADGQLGGELDAVARQVLCLSEPFEDFGLRRAGDAASPLAADDLAVVIRGGFPSERDRGDPSFTTLVVAHATLAV